MIVGYIFFERARDDMDAMRIVMAGMWMQDAGSLSSGNSRLLMFFVGMVAIAMSVQAIVVVVIAIGAAKMSKRAFQVVDEVKTKIGPIMETTQNVLRDSAPKVKVITENLVETSHMVRSKAAEFDATASELNMKTRAQVTRVDGMVTSVLNTTSEISDSLQKAVKVPVREIQGLVNGFKAGLDVLVGRAKEFGRGTPVATYRTDTPYAPDREL
jgi:hypothetical protein